MVPPPGRWLSSQRAAAARRPAPRCRAGREPRRGSGGGPTPSSLTRRRTRGRRRGPARPRRAAPARAGRRWSAPPGRCGRRSARRSRPGPARAPAGPATVTPCWRSGSASSSSMSGRRGGARHGDRRVRVAQVHDQRVQLTQRRTARGRRSSAAPARGSPTWPASACTTIAVTWWPTTSCSSRASVGALLEPGVPAPRSSSASSRERVGPLTRDRIRMAEQPADETSDERREVPVERTNSDTTAPSEPAGPAEPREGRAGRRRPRRTPGRRPRGHKRPLPRSHWPRRTRRRRSPGRRRQRPRGRPAHRQQHPADHGARCCAVSSRTTTGDRARRAGDQPARPRNRFGSRARVRSPAPSPGQSGSAEVPVRRPAGFGTRVPGGLGTRPVPRNAPPDDRGRHDHIVPPPRAAVDAARSARRTVPNCITARPHRRRRRRRLVAVGVGRPAPAGRRVRHLLGRRHARRLGGPAARPGDPAGRRPRHRERPGLHRGALRRPGRPPCRASLAGGGGLPAVVHGPGHHAVAGVPVLAGARARTTSTWSTAGLAAQLVAGWPRPPTPPASSARSRSGCSSRWPSPSPCVGSSCVGRRGSALLDGTAG